MKTFTDMNFEEIGRAYDNTSAVSNSGALLNIFEQKSLLVLKKYPHTNILYGKKPRQNIDYFHIKDNAPIFVFIHGGYWQMRQKETFFFLVDFFAKKQINIAFLGYTLAPENNIYEIEKELKNALYTLRENDKNLCFDKDSIILSGWSAGGHLSTLLANEEGIIKVLAISGIYDLEPIRRCFLNDKLSLNKEDVKALSPIYKNSFLPEIKIVCGQSELSELIRQSKDFYDKFKDKLNKISFKTIENANHFTILLDEKTFEL